MIYLIVGFLGFSAHQSKGPGGVYSTYLVKSITLPLGYLRDGTVTLPEHAKAIPVPRFTCLRIEWIPACEPDDDR